MLKRDAPPEFVRAVQKIEDQSDTWLHGLAICGFRYDVAIWGVLTEIVRQLEIAVLSVAIGSPAHRDQMVNLSRAGALLAENLSAVRTQESTHWPRWTRDLSSASKAAVAQAVEYDPFITHFTLWHRDSMHATILGHNHVRLDCGDSAMQTRVRAYMQGFRTRLWPSTPDNQMDVLFANDPRIAPQLASLLERTTCEGALAIRYPEDFGLLCRLRDSHLSALTGSFRRAQLALDHFTLADLRVFFASLLALCNVHEHICYAWGSAKRAFPLESAVMSKPSRDWVESLATLSELPLGKVEAIVKLMILDTARHMDLHVQPFVPIEHGGRLLVVPHLVSNCRVEEVVLRSYSEIQPENQTCVTKSKEDETRDAIRKEAPRYRVDGPITLPVPLPNIDIVIQQEGSPVVVIGELKWVRHAILAVEHASKNQELFDGIGQLRAIREFLLENPAFLRDRGVVAKGTDVSKLSFALIVRDHITWIPEEEDIWMTEFDALVEVVKRAGDLKDAVGWLRSYAWLPKEGIDFRATYEPAKAGGVVLDVGVFHRLP